MADRHMPNEDKATEADMSRRLKELGSRIGEAGVRRDQQAQELRKEILDAHLETLAERIEKGDLSQRLTLVSVAAEFGPPALPLLERVSHPVATNPTAALETLARERGWPILKLFE